ncbi:MAG: glycosyl transferase family protein [Halioglobus sp.]|nr:glycosyl transferase family protein [Halioglobus sp.]
MTTPGAEHPFAAYVRILGKGKTGTRSLDRQEARDAFAMILRGAAEPVQIGAFLMLLRVKEESPEEIAGFVEACRDTMHAPPALEVDLDWASYAGKKHQHPWFVLAMLLLAQAGYRVFVHGTAGHTPGRLYTETAMRDLGLPVATDWSGVSPGIARAGICYLPLRGFCPGLEEIMQLRPLLGLRSPVNTLVRMINPLAARSSIQSIFHPAYTRIHQEADRLLGQPAALVFKGESGEVEIKPQADTRLYLLREAQSRELLAARALHGRPAPVEQPSTEPLRQLWRGTRTDDYGTAATLATTAAALVLLRPGNDLEDGRREAERLWRRRDTGMLD